MGLDITNLIEKAEAITTDEQIGFAAAITYPVQEIEYDGKVYQLELILRIK